MKRRFIQMLPGILLVAVLCGCGLTQAKQDGEKLVASHFQMIATNGYEAVTSQYGNQFFQQMPRNEWSTTLVQVTRKLGQYEQHSVNGWRVFKGANTFGAGTTVALQCQVKYSKYSAVENFTLFKGATDSEYKIIGHHINSDGLLKE